MTALKTVAIKMSSLLSRKTLMEAALANDLARVKKCVRVFPHHLSEPNLMGETPLNEYRGLVPEAARNRKIEAQLTPPFEPQNAWTTKPRWYGQEGAYAFVAW
jgi:hypothetical protein